MRASFSRWSLVVATATCMSLVSVTGCKSGGMNIPGADWLSWGKKPSPTSISSSSQRKPSTSALPGPSATTAASSSLATYPNYQSGAQAQANKGYRTGPYGTGSTPQPGADRFAGSAARPSGGSPYANNSYGGSSTGSPSSPYAATPYQSPYQSSSNTPPSSASGGYNAAANRYATADSRNSLYNATQSAGSAPSTGAWNSPPARRGGDPYSSVEPAGHSAAGSYPQAYNNNPSATNQPTRYSTSAPTTGDQWSGNRSSGWLALDGRRGQRQLPSREHSSGKQLATRGHSEFVANWRICRPGQRDASQHVSNDRGHHALWWRRLFLPEYRTLVLGPVSSRTC